MTTRATDSIREYHSSAYKVMSDVSQLLLTEFADTAMCATDKKFSATEFILVWMREHFLFQRKFDALFQRSVASSAGDQFTAVVALTLEKFLEAHGMPRCVKSEVKVALESGDIKPDVSIWCNGELRAIIECKTQFGRKRNEWADEYHNRTQRLNALHPKCLSFLCVLTRFNWESSWPQFRDSSLAGDKWFCLTQHWPSSLPEDVREGMIHEIAPMFDEILKLLKEHA